MHYALVLETDGFDFLIDTRDLWRPSWVLVRRGLENAEVWLDDDDVSFVRPPRLRPAEREQVLELVREHVDELAYAWISLKDDVRRGRLGRNTLVE